MRDKDIRQRLAKSVLARYSGDPRTRVVEELCLGNSRSRIDMAVINGELIGYEIKSPVDTLSRLKRQACDYGAVFDRVMMVVGECHLTETVKSVPEWWGILIACDGAEITFENYRAAARNEAVQSDALVKLLWRDEALMVLQNLGVDYGVRSLPKKHVWMRLAEVTTTQRLRSEVRSALKARKDWKADPLSSLCGD